MGDGYDKIVPHTGRRSHMSVHFSHPVLCSENRNKLIRLINCRVLKEQQIVRDDVWIRNGVIQCAREVFFSEQAEADIVVDCHGLIVSPGFIDIQINGAFGFDFSTFTEGYDEGVAMVRKGLLAHGVTTFAPTVITSAPSTYKVVLPRLRARDGDINGAGMVGAHVEGPFISAQKRGCHPLQYVQGDLVHHDPLTLLMDTYGNLDHIALITIAPELPGAIDAIRVLSSRGIVVSLGHTSANLADGENGVAAGASSITHLFNAMQTYHHRDAGTIGLLTSKKIPVPHVFYGLISDGIHADDTALRLAYRTSPEGVILITDAIGALGMGEGVHNVGVQRVNVSGMLALLEGTTTTAGSVASIPHCIAYFVRATGCSLAEALLAVTARPAALLKLTSKGSIRTGADADLVLIDDSVGVHATIVGGRMAYVQ